MEKGAIKVAVLGCGRWGPNHIRNLSSLSGVRVVACVDPDRKKLAQVRAVYPGVQGATDAARVLEGDIVDAVVVATPTSTHYALTKRALQAGKHVLCEKPLCETSREARELASLARRKKRVLMVGHVFLFNGGVIKLKRIIESGELGDLRYLSSIHTNLGPIRGDVNAAYDLASHDISVFNWLLDSAPRSVSATGACYLQAKIEDVVFITLAYPDGVYANIHASWLNAKKVRHAIVVGSKKMASWDDQELSTPITIYDKGAHVRETYRDYSEFLRVALWEGEVRNPKVTLEEPLRVQDRDFLQAVRTGEVERSGPEFAAGVVAALEAASRSMKLQGRPVKVRL